MAGYVPTPYRQPPWIPSIYTLDDNAIRNERAERRRERSQRERSERSQRSQRAEREKSRREWSGRSHREHAGRERSDVTTRGEAEHGKRTERESLQRERERSKRLERERSERSQLAEGLVRQSRDRSVRRVSLHQDRTDPHDKGRSRFLEKNDTHFKDFHDKLSYPPSGVPRTARRSVSLTRPYVRSEASSPRRSIDRSHVGDDGERKPHRNRRSSRSADTGGTVEPPGGTVLLREALWRREYKRRELEQAVTGRREAWEWGVSESGSLPKIEQSQVDCLRLPFDKDTDRVAGYKEVVAQSYSHPSLLWAFTELRLNRVDRGQSAIDYDPSQDTAGCQSLTKKMHRSFMTLQYADPIVKHRERIATRYGLRVGNSYWWQACCCPCRSVKENEVYIVAAEASREHELQKKRQGKYEMHPPMLMSKSVARRIGSREPSTGAPTEETKPSRPASMSHQRVADEPMPAIPEKEKALHVQSPVKDSQTAPLASTSGNVPGSVSRTMPPKEPKSPVRSPRQAERVRRKHHPGSREFSDPVSTSDENLHEESTPRSISPLDLHSIHNDAVVSMPQAVHVHRLSNDAHAIIHQTPRGLHALHLDPVHPVAPETHAKFDPKWLQMPQMPQPLVPKVHRLSQDMTLDHAPGAYPTSSPPPPPSPAAPDTKAHDLEADQTIETGPQQPGDQNHRLSDDVQLSVAPPVAGRWPSQRLKSPPGTDGGKGKQTSHELGVDAGDEVTPVGEHGIELYRLSNDMLTPTKV